MGVEIFVTWAFLKWNPISVLYPHGGGLSGDSGRLGKETSLGRDGDHIL